MRDPAFGDLKRLLTRHAAAFAKDLAWEVKPKLDSLWVNLLKSGGHHSGHIHPHSILSGTFYVEAPPGSGAIRFEDPRLPMMMAAPSAAPTRPSICATSSPSNRGPGCCCCGKASSATKSSPAPPRPSG